MDVQTVLTALADLGSAQIKKRYISQGAREPLFGVAVGAMKPLFKQVGINQTLADALYATGNYDAMYFAGMIADPLHMTAEDFNRWMESAYFYMISDFIVAVTLAESTIAQDAALNWIDRSEPLYRSAGYHCFCWLIGNRKDSELDEGVILNLLEDAASTIHQSSDPVKNAMNNFIITVGISYRPLHERALYLARQTGLVQSSAEGGLKFFTDAAAEIEKAQHKNRIGFKRRHVRC